MKRLSFGLIAVLLTPMFAPAAEPPAAAQKIFKKILAAIEANNRDAMVADATDAVKEGVTKEVAENLHKELGPRLKKGYDATYLCQLKQSGLQIHLWKVAFKDGKDDLIVRIGMKDGKVDGFFLQ